MDRLIAQTALQPGIVTAIKQILHQGKTYSFVFLDASKHIALVSV